MSSLQHAIDLSQLPAPQVVEGLDYEALLTARSNELNGLSPLLVQDGQPALLDAQLMQTDGETYWKIPVNDTAGMWYVDLSSDPMVRQLQADTYRELLHNNRVNKAALSTMLAFAQGSDLDHWVAGRGIERLVIAPATSTSVVVMESDDALRKRAQLWPESLASGLSKGWYLYHALSADGLVKDVYAGSPDPCDVEVVVLSHEGDGTASDELLEKVDTDLRGRYQRWNGDRLTVRSAVPVHYAVTADVQLYVGPSAAPVLADIRARYDVYRENFERLGHSVYRSAVDAYLHAPGVYRAVPTSPELPIELNYDHAAFCSGLTLNEVSE